MSEELISLLYPPPPPYYKFFNAENIEKFKSWKLENQDADAVPPGELKLQVPPTAPTGNQYRGYGSIWALTNDLPSLKESGWRQLYNEEDEKITSKTKIVELHKLLDSLLLNFLELVGIMSVEPAKFYTKIEDMKLILINMNHLLNTYRPHQTRESLIMALKKQIEKKRSEIDNIDEVMADAKRRISALIEKDEFANMIVDENLDENNKTSKSASSHNLEKLHRMLDEPL